MIPTAALRRALQPQPVDPDSAAYNQATNDTVAGILWIIDDRLQHPLPPSAKSELLRLRTVLKDRHAA